MAILIFVSILVTLAPFDFFKVDQLVAENCFEFDFGLTRLFMGDFPTQGREIHAIFIIVMWAVDSWSLIVASARILILKKLTPLGQYREKAIKQFYSVHCSIQMCDIQN